MNVKIIKTGKVEAVNAGYGLRLIEQGKAVPAPAAVKKAQKKENVKAGEA